MINMIVSKFIQENVETFPSSFVNLLSFSLMDFGPSSDVTWWPGNSRYILAPGTQFQADRAIGRVLKFGLSVMVAGCSNKTPWDQKLRYPTRWVGFSWISSYSEYDSIIKFNILKLICTSKELNLNSFFSSETFVLVLVPGVMIILYHCFWGALLENIYHSRKMALEHIILRLLYIIYWYLQHVQIQYIVHKTSNNFRFAMLNLAQKSHLFPDRGENHGGVGARARWPKPCERDPKLKSIWRNWTNPGGTCRHGNILFGGILGICL